MSVPSHLTKIVATIGPASRSPELLRSMADAGMSVARINLSHGSYEDHARTIRMIRDLSAELDRPIGVLLDLQGPKIRVADIPGGSIELTTDRPLSLAPAGHPAASAPDTVAIDYPHVASEAVPGTPVLLADGLFELCVEAVEGDIVRCRVVKGGTLTPRKGVNFPTLHLKLPSMTEKDERDLAFGVKQGVDWVSLSFVRTAGDVRALKTRLADLGRAALPVVAKLEKPAAIENLESILVEVDGIMVARGDLGVELPPEEVPMIQKRIIRRCNQLGLPVITATQMLESMIQNPRPTRAEASDVANAIADGTDAVMLSGETAVGAYPVQAVAMMSRIAATVEKQVRYVNHPAARSDDAHALSEALRALLGVVEARCIVAFTASGRTALLASQERLAVPIYAFTPCVRVCGKLSLAWGVRPILIEERVTQLEDGIRKADEILVRRGLAKPGDRVIVVGGIPMGVARGNNTLKIHRVGEAAAT